MLRNDMKNIKIAIFVLMVVGVCRETPGFELESLTTVRGKEYRDIEILDADRHGLLFRHRDGIAKESFAFLSQAIGDMFRPVEALQGEAVEPAAGEGEEATAGEIDAAWQLTWTVRQRVFFPAQPPCGNPRECRLHPHPGNWPSWWHRFRCANYLTNPLCRELALRDFLITTGLRPRPAGVKTYRFPGPTPFPLR